MPQTTAPQFTLKGRLFFRPDGSDTEHDLGEIELGPVQPIVNAYAKRQTFATGGIVDDPTPIRTERRGEHTIVPQDEVRRVAFAAGGHIFPADTAGLDDSIRASAGYVVPNSVVRSIVGDLGTLPKSMKPNLPDPRTAAKSAIATAVRGMTVDMYNGR